MNNEEMKPGTIEFKGKTEEFIDYWAEDNNLVFLLKDNTKLVCENFYVSNISFNGLETSSSEKMGLVGNDYPVVSVEIYPAIMDENYESQLSSGDTMEEAIEKVLDGYPLIYHLASRNK